MVVAIIIAVIITIIAVWCLVYGYSNDRDNPAIVGVIAALVAFFVWVGVGCAALQHAKHSEIRAAVTETFHQQYHGDAVLFAVHPNDNTVEFAREDTRCMMSFGKDYKHVYFFGPEYCTVDG